MYLNNSRKMVKDKYTIHLVEVLVEAAVDVEASMVKMLPARLNQGVQILLY